MRQKLESALLIGREILRGSHTSGEVAGAALFSRFSVIQVDLFRSSRRTAIPLSKAFDAGEARKCQTALLSLCSGYPSQLFHIDNGIGGQGDTVGSIPRSDADVPNSS